MNFESILKHCAVNLMSSEYLFSNAVKKNSPVTNLVNTRVQTDGNGKASRNEAGEARSEVAKNEGTDKAAGKDVQRVLDPTSDLCKDWRVKRRKF